jgi:HAD superfamily hydrolase (TIGR01509 family)
MIEAVIFDMDGVLVDSEPHHSAIERNQFILNGISISEEEHRAYTGTSTEMMLQDILTKHQLQLTLGDLVSQNRQASIKYFTELQELKVMDGLVDLLEKLTEKKYKLAVASSSFPEIIDIILNKTKLRKYFQVVVSGEEAGKSKPEPDIFLLAGQKLGISQKNCMVVEDSEAGIMAAQAARMSCVAYQGPGADPKKQKEADAIVKSFEQLAMMLQL